jgi:hypothetical protein
MTDEQKIKSTSVWYYLDGDQQCGPINKDELQMIVSAGRIKPDNLVWTEGMTEWSQAHNIKEIQWPSVTPPPPPNHVVTYQPPANIDNLKKIRNYLPWAIIATIFLFIPTGIISIIYSLKAKKAKKTGDYILAKQSANKAKRWIIISIIVASFFLIAGLSIILVVSNLVDPLKDDKYSALFDPEEIFKKFNIDEANQLAHILWPVEHYFTIWDKTIDEYRDVEFKKPAVDWEYINFLETKRINERYYFYHQGEDSFVVKMYGKNDDYFLVLKFEKLAGDQWYLAGMSNQNWRY